MSDNRNVSPSDLTLEESNFLGRRRPLRSGSFCQPERLTTSVNLPKRSQSFRSCLKKPTTIRPPESGQSSRRSSGSKAVMFTDEVGNNLEEVKKYDVAEPINIPDEVISELYTDGEEVEIEIQDTFNDVENVRYMDEVRPVTLKEANMNMKIFGNPRVKKSQSFNHVRRPTGTGDSPECPKNSPLESVCTTPICSPVMVHRIPSVDVQQMKSLEKSQSFCMKLSTIPDECLQETAPHQPRLSRLILPQPEIVLTSPRDSPQTESCAPLSRIEESSQYLNASIEKLSKKLLSEGIETYLALTNSDYGEAQPSQSSRRSSSSSLPPPPSTAPPPLPSL